MAFDLLLKDALTRASPDKPVDIGITGGRIQAIHSDLGSEAAQIINARGCLDS